MAFSRQKKRVLMQSTTHTQNQLRGHNPLARFGLLFKSHFFTTGSLCSFPRFSPPVFAIQKIFSQSDFPQIAFSFAFRRAERRASGPVGATPLGRAGGREHDILWRQNVSKAAGAAAEHEGRPVESERGRVVARMVRSTDSEKKYAMCSWTNAPRSAGSATRRRRPRASNPPRRDLCSFPRDRPDEIAARPRDAPRGRPVFAPRRPAFAARQLGGQLWPDRVRLTATTPLLPRESAGIFTTA